MKATRVLHVAATSVPFTNGYTMRLRSVLQQQRDRGLQPTVITSPFYPGRLDPPGPGRFDGVPHRRSRHPAETGGGGAWGAAVRGLRRLQRSGRALGPAAIVLEERLLLRRFAAQIEAAAREEGAELIHAHTPYRCGLPSLQVARRLRVPCVYEVRGIWEDTAVADGNLAPGGAGYRYVRGREDVTINSHERNSSEYETVFGQTSEFSDAMEKELKKTRGFKFLGSITLQAFMLQCGLLNGHCPRCPCNPRSRPAAADEVCTPVSTGKKRQRASEAASQARVSKIRL